MRNKVFEAGSSITISTENISDQKDTQIVKLLTGYFEDISENINNKNIRKGKALSHRPIRVAFAKIDKAVTDRFGINIKTVESTQHLLAVQTTPPKDVNVLAGNVKRNYAHMGKLLKREGTTSGRVESDDIDVRMANWETILKTYRQSVDSVDRMLEADGITVDLINAKVYGYPKTATTIVLIDPVRLIGDVNMSPKELTAAYLHEIGHAFTHIEYSYRAIKNTTTLIDSLITEIGNNKQPLEAIKLSYSKTFNDDSISGTKNISSAIVGVTSKYLENLDNMGGNTYSNKDSERLADQFVNRLGHGEYLATGLAKLHKYIGEAPGNTVTDMGKVILWLYLISVILGIFLPTIGMLLGSLVVGLTVQYLLIITLSIVAYAIYSVLSALFSRGIDAEFPYDSPKRRILRIKSDMVRSLRTNNIGKEETEAIINSIDLLVTVSEDLDDNNENTIYRMMGSFFTYSKDQNEMRDLDNAVDDLMNNDLHVMANKFKTI